MIHFIRLHKIDLHLFLTHSEQETCNYSDLWCLMSWQAFVFPFKNELQVTWSFYFCNCIFNEASDKWESAAVAARWFGLNVAFGFQSIKVTWKRNKSVKYCRNVSHIEILIVTTGSIGRSLKRQNTTMLEMAVQKVAIDLVLPSNATRYVVFSTWGVTYTLCSASNTLICSLFKNSEWLFAVFQLTHWNNQLKISHLSQKIPT